MSDSPLWVQRILFGPPGCGKSYRVRSEAKAILGIDEGNSRRFVETTFHPEYSYGDFMAKLLPYSRSRAQSYSVSGSSLDGAIIQEQVAAPKIEYRIHVGPLMKALAVAYVQQNEQVLLAIDEINRGNCAHIFGDIFQLLDRCADGWSEYGVDMSDLFRMALEQELQQFGKKLSDLPEQLKINDIHGAPQYKLRLPPNLSIMATMNTSDESVYYMDTAFKRRWDFLYMPWESDAGEPGYAEHASALIEHTAYAWRDVLARLNIYIAENFAGRNVDDKQVGIWFLKSKSVLTQKLPLRLEELRAKLEPLIDNAAHQQWARVFPNAKLYDRSGTHLDTLSVKSDFEEYGIGWPPDVNWWPAQLAATLIAWIDKQPKVHTQQISRSAIANKLMFFLWDNVFTRDRSRLANLLKITAPETAEPRTFGEFTTETNVALFINGLMYEASADTGPAA